MTLNISHSTHYNFDSPPAYGLQQLRLTPVSTYGQEILEWSVSYDGARSEAQFTDQHGNLTELIIIDAEAVKLSVHARGRVAVTDHTGVAGPHIGFTPLWLYLRQTALTQAGTGVMRFVKAARRHKGTDLDRLHALSADIRGKVGYYFGATDSYSTAENAISAGSGVCQDHAHIFISAARSLGFPARYVSGYLMLDDRIAQDAMHAWGEIYVEGLGWTGFDISNQIAPDGRYVRVATGLDYSQAAPISGLTLGGAGESIHVDIQVQQ